MLQPQLLLKPSERLVLPWTTRGKFHRCNWPRNQVKSREPGLVCCIDPSEIWTFRWRKLPPVLLGDINLRLAMSKLDHLKALERPTSWYLPSEPSAVGTLPWYTSLYDSALKTEGSWFHFAFSKIFLTLGIPPLSDLLWVHQMFASIAEGRKGNELRQVSLQLYLPLVKMNSLYRDRLNVYFYYLFLMKRSVLFCAQQRASWMFSNPSIMLERSRSNENTMGFLKTEFPPQILKGRRFCQRVLERTGHSCKRLCGL